MEPIVPQGPGLEGEALVTGQLAQCRPQQQCPLAQARLLRDGSPTGAGQCGHHPPQVAGARRMLKLSFLEGGVSSRCHSWSPLTRVAWAPGPHGLGPHTPPASPLWCLENFSRFCVAGSFLTKARDLSKGRLPCEGRPDEETEAPGGFETCLASTRSVCEVGTAGLIFRLQDSCSVLRHPVPPTRCQAGAFQPH